MANWLEKQLPKPIRDNTRTLLATALGLFLALQYNEFIKNIFETFFPLDTNNLIGRFVYITVLTIVIVYAIVFVEKALDGK